MNNVTSRTLSQSQESVTGMNTPVTLRGPLLLVARIAWIAVALLTVTVLALLASRGYTVLLVEGDISNAYAAVQTLMRFTTFARIILIARYITLAVFLLTAFFIFWRKSDDWMGYITSLMLLTLPLIFSLGGVVPVTIRTPLESILTWSWQLSMIGLLAVFVFLNVFPTGRFISRWLSRIFWLGMGLIVLSAVISDMGGVQVRTFFEQLMAGILFGWFALSIAGQVYRYARVSGSIERQQSRWVFASLGLIAIWAIAVYFRPPPRTWDSWAGALGLFRLFGTAVVLSLLPLSIARAILRYRLWDIDVIVRKTLVYTLLTGFLLLVYFTSIVALQGLFSRITGQDSTLATILSTLLIAALFLPLRRQIQGGIDRRFFRRKYNAEQVLADFAATARDETDLDRLTAELLRVIEKTMEPEHVSLWLMPAARPQSMTADSPDSRGV